MVLALNKERNGAGLVELIDSHLEFVRDFGCKTLTTVVYKVRSKGKPAVLKIALADKPWAIDHLKAEKAGLEALAGIKGIPKLYAAYYKDDEHGNFLYLALLKEYVKGIPLTNRPEAKRMLNNSIFQRNMASLVQAVNNRGVILREGPNELCYNNIIVDDSCQPHFIDLGYAMMPNSLIVKHDKFAILKWLLEQQYHQFREAYFPHVQRH